MAEAIDITECRDCLCLASRRAALAITRAFERKLRPHGIRVTQFTLLTNLMLRGPIAIGALADGLGVDRTTLTRNLALIEGEGWLRLRPGKDARSRIVAITAAGTRKVEAAYPAWQAAQRDVSRTIGDAGVASLHRLAAEPVN